MPARKIPFVGTPDTNPETKPFFDAAAAGKLVVPRCKDTGKFFWYPRGISPFTLGPVEWVEVSGNAKIYSLSVMERANPPYAMAYVTLAEGPTMMTNLVDCDFKALKIGQDVKVTFVQTEGEGPSMPCFTPA
ncbi:MAG TPA: OB-fold domain-containing protein [Rhodopila sp.]|jgi:hypothetical protein